MPVVNNPGGSHRETDRDSSRPSKPPAKEPPGNAKPPTGVDFVATEIKFVPPVGAKGATVLLTVKRNLALTQKVTQFYANFFMTSVEGPPGYYGDVVLKGGNEAACAKPEFTIELRAVSIHSVDYKKQPDGTLGRASGPSTRWPAWLQLRWAGADGKLRSLAVEQVPVKA